MKFQKFLLPFVMMSTFALGTAFAEGEKKTVAESKTAPCCAKAEAKGEKCTHGCCVEAAKNGDNCTSCKGSGKIEKKPEAKT